MIMITVVLLMLKCLPQLEQLGFRELLIILIQIQCLQVLIHLSMVYGNQMMRVVPSIKFHYPEGNVDLNDLEVQEVSNRIWISSTKNQYWGSQYGGRFYYSDDGTTFCEGSTKFPCFSKY